MEGRTNYVVVYEDEIARYKLCRIIYGSDGSYYVTCPYRDPEEAMIVKLTINYAKPQQDIAFEQTVESASASDRKRAIKLSHHPDGFVQFSGPGITSGRDKKGSIRGMGLMSWTHEAPAQGPSFGVTIHGLDRFDSEPRERAGDITFRRNHVSFVPEPRVLVVEGYFFPPMWRRFIRDADGQPILSVVHPTGMVLALKALLPRLPDRPFLGIELYSIPVEPEASEPAHGFTISSSTGNVRKNELGELIADGLYCIVPRPDLPIGHSLNYPTISSPQPPG